jgi:isovaleryl-CoA dehydrogenase
MNFLRFEHGETLDMLRDSVRDFAQKEIAPRADEIDRSNQFPPDLWQKLARSAFSASRSRKPTAAQ